MEYNRVRARPPISPSRRNLGFSLIEAVVAMSVASIGLALGLPSYQSAIQHQREAATINLLSSFLASARSTAITYRKPTIVCPHDGKGQCRDDSDWTQGWMMFYDADGNHRADSLDELLRLESAPHDQGLRVISTDGRPRLTFLPNGSAAGSNLTFRLCREGSAKTAVFVNRGGRIRVEKSENAQACET